MLPLSEPEIDKGLQKKCMAWWMRITLANLWVYVTFRAGGMGEIERPTEFQGQHNPAQMMPTF